MQANSPSLVSWYWQDDALRSRRVGGRVIAGVVDVPAPPPRLLADWAREIATNMVLEPGEVEVLPLARARLRWPDYRQCVQAVADWTRALGLPDVLDDCEVALMVCRGARYHHDGGQYGGAAFCNLFLADDKGQDVHFVALDQRIALRRGTVLLFDPCQPHGVIRRGGAGFDAADFPDGQDTTQVFLTWELPIEDARVAQALGVTFDAAPTGPAGDAPGLRRDGRPVDVCPATGQWQPAGPAA
ncbi:hypothetical protein [Cupriavidus pauculus]|uniref:Uncharacterized protein n=1 Tax=Cupriavidus pauculus TaxID=82633 RepID=A0A3G8H7Q1_9BURK|nr:hypothetical protein [Cupriavidus pauculus]AZG16577.1 hypothetical protein EHF44_24690 [Cupriavidus pauculus]